MGGMFGGGQKANETSASDQLALQKKIIEAQQASNLEVQKQAAADSAKAQAEKEAEAKAKEQADADRRYADSVRASDKSKQAAASEDDEEETKKVGLGSF